MRNKKFVLGAIIFLVSSLSFAIGYLANRELNHSPIVIEACGNPAQGGIPAQKENPR